MEANAAAGQREDRGVKHQKSYFDVLGICCSSEVYLIENILKSLDGVHKVSVIVPSKTAIVVHDSTIISQLQIAQALNQASLEASVRTYGSNNIVKRWPSPFILLCGLLLVVSMFKWLINQLKWLALAAAIVGVPPIAWRGIGSMRRCRLDINILMLIAVAVSIALKDFTEAGFIAFLFGIAEWLESIASQDATTGMSSLMNMLPRRAILSETGEVVNTEDVKIDTVLAVKAGELIPIDGIVVEGQGEVDERSLTGESFPVLKQPGSRVSAGTVNIEGYISFRTTTLADQSAVASMARLVEEAQSSRPKIQRFIDSWTKYYTPATYLQL